MRRFGTTGKMMPHIELHPLCTLFPRLPDAEFAALSADIAANGLRQPIVMHDGMILDGGNRYRACLDAGVKPSFVDFKGDNIGSFVRSVNMHRRHMTPGQMAAVVASIQTWGEAHPPHRTEGCNVAPLSTVADRAADSGASHRTQQMADKVAKKSPDLARKVAQGHMTLPAAHREVSQPLPKILPRRNVEADAPQVADPMDKARDYAKKQNAALRKMKVELAERDATITALKEELHESRHIARELAHDLESYMTVSEGEKAIAKELSALKAQMGVIEGTRDSFMNKCNVLVKEVKSLQRKLKVTQ